MFRLVAMMLTAASVALAAPAMAQQPPAQPTPQSATPPVTAPAGAPAKPAPGASIADGYVLGTGDMVEVVVLGRAEFAARVQVQTDGTIQLPYLHAVKAADMTVLQLRAYVTKLLKDGGFYTDPVVNVAVVNYASRYVTVLGEVANPGLVPVDRAYRISEILARVGGARVTGADELKLRHADGKEMTLAISTIASGGDDQDPYVAPGDKIFIEAAPTFYIYGQVAAPGSYRVDRDMTLRMALARSGGLTDRGSEGKIKIFRDGKEIKKQNLNAPIKGGDTIVIGERFL